MGGKRTLGPPPLRQAGQTRAVINGRLELARPGRLRSLIHTEKGLPHVG